MTKTARAVLVLFATVMIAGCASKAPQSKPVSATSASYEAATAAARDAQKKAASVGGEWRDIGSTLDKADAAAKAGDLAGAIKLADWAREQSEMGYEQALAQEKAGAPSYLK